ncbi:hypothetical protein KC318_g7248 [Hortaea werneckii]|uniref:F-box domain-containing protein n=1 Tax=Hortaea werneckii TaxID=91943 RepID=A0A3M6ZRW1_HORWE|nr:hypothetical protein KC334_g9675 [Hortaea werneckii]KAI7002589.1 hypothetical protein KC355_g9717 [Hortaea werneckii]KAI7665227.1 hypothetical protein KC318_g7248 [Hortaea werneckii]RMY18044.1 hypothetical protein D0867_05605 [Hortaea werneckii]
MGDDLATPGQSDLRDDAKGGENDPPFLKLPAELRTIIYRYAAVNSTSVQLYLGDVNRSRSKSEFRDPDRRALIINMKPHPHPLALTCRTFYREVRPIYCVENTFCLSNLTTTEKLHVDYIKQYRKMMGPFAKKVKKVSVDYRFHVGVEVQTTFGSIAEKFEQIWVKLNVLFDEDGVLRIETRMGNFANLCLCGLFHLAKNHSAQASDTKLLDFLEAMFKVASGHHCRDIFKECTKCGGKRRFKRSPWLRTDRKTVW